MVSGKAAEIDAKYGSISVDVNYWTLALKIAKVCKAKAFLLQRHKEIMSDLKKEKAAKESNTERFDDSNTASENVSKFSLPMMTEREGIKDEEKKCPHAVSHRGDIYLFTDWCSNLRCPRGAN